MNNGRFPASLVPGTVYLDTETTGLGQDAEVLEVCVLNDEGEALVNARCKPEHATEWPGAQEIHGIAPDDVADCPAFGELAAEIQKHIDAASRVCIYNAEYDMRPLRRAGIEVDDAKLHDTMLDFSATRRVVDPKHGGWKWFKLADAAKRCHYQGVPDHSAFGDCLATRHVQRFCDCWRAYELAESYESNYGELIARLWKASAEASGSQAIPLAAEILGVPRDELERDLALARRIGLVC